MAGLLHREQPLRPLNRVVHNFLSLHALRVFETELANLHEYVRLTGASTFLRTRTRSRLIGRCGPQSNHHDFALGSTLVRCETARHAMASNEWAFLSPRSIVFAPLGGTRERKNASSLLDSVVDGHL